MANEETIPTDDVALFYAPLSEDRKRAISALMKSSCFLLQTAEGYSAYRGCSLEQMLDMMASVVLQVKEEYGNAFIRSFIRATNEALMEGEREDDNSSTR